MLFPSLDRYTHIMLAYRDSVALVHLGEKEKKRPGVVSAH